MSDDSSVDIPIAQRQPSIHPSTTPPSRRVGQRILLGSLLLGSLGLSGLGVQQFILTSDPGNPELTESSANPTSPPTLPPTPLAVLGHYQYAEASLSALERIGTYRGREVTLHHQAAASFRAMTAAAQQAGIRLVPISGFRTVQDQQYLFFDIAQQQGQRPIDRAHVSAPPGYSEHHTGYALDIGDASAPATDITVQFEHTPAFQWLAQHAARFGFELSFPEGNPQHVSYEPWHWRYVGDQTSLETFYQHTPADPSTSTDPDTPLPPSLVGN